MWSILYLYNVLSVFLTETSLYFDRPWWKEGSDEKVNESLVLWEASYEGSYLPQTWYE